MAPILPGGGIYVRNSTTPTPTPTPINPNISSYNTSNTSLVPSSISTSLTPSISATLTPFPTSSTTTTTSSATSIDTSSVDNPTSVALSSIRPFIAPIVLIVVGFIIISFLCCCVRWSQFKKSNRGGNSNSGLKKIGGGGSVSSSTANIVCNSLGEHRCSNCGTFIASETDFNDDDQGTSEGTERPDSSRVSFHLKVEEFGKGRKRRDGDDESENGSSGDCPPIVQTKSSFIEIIDTELDSQSISPVPSLRSETPPPERPSTPIVTSPSPQDRTSERFSSATLIAEEKEENVDEVEAKKQMK